MRSAVAAGLAMLAGCQADQDTQHNGASQVASEAPLPAPAPAAPRSNPAPTADTPGEPARAIRFRALGTEPFWSIEVIGNRLRYSSPEQIEAIAVDATIAVDGKRTSYAGILQGKPVVLTIDPGECSDGMSDRIYPYTASFTWGDRTEHGCAHR